jgi:hypothetical protein
MGVFGNQELVLGRVSCRITVVSPLSLATHTRHINRSMVRALQTRRKIQ